MISKPVNLSLVVLLVCHVLPFAEDYVFLNWNSLMLCIYEVHVLFLGPRAKVPEISTFIIIIIHVYIYIYIWCIYIYIILSCRLFSNQCIFLMVYGSTCCPSFWCLELIGHLFDWYIKSGVWIPQAKVRWNFFYSNEMIDLSVRLL